jgi:hypothetical protein
MNTPPEMTALQMATTWELCEELFNRRPASLIIMTKESTPDNPGHFEVHGIMENPSDVAIGLGLCDAAKLFLKERFKWVTGLSESGGGDVTNSAG